MAFKMKGWEAFTKKMNKTMDNSSKADGRAKSSAFQKEDKDVAHRASGRNLRRPKISPTKEFRKTQEKPHRAPGSGEYVPQSKRDFDYIPQSRKDKARDRKEAVDRRDSGWDVRSESPTTAFKKEKDVTYKGPEEFEGPGGYAKNTAKALLEKGRKTKVGKGVEKAVKGSMHYKAGKAIVKGGIKTGKSLVKGAKNFLSKMKKK